MGLVDFEKAFDSIEHEALWQVLADQGVDTDYIDLLAALYENQAAAVTAGAKSRDFLVERGVKQGDPVSALLFIAVMEQISQSLKLRWNSLNSCRNGQYYDMVIDSAADPLTNLRFADDVLLIAGSMSDVGRMIKDLKTEAKKFGLILHPGKTKVLTNSAGKRPDYIDCDGQVVEILKEGGAERYLGRKLTVDDYHGTEMSHRIEAGWKAFFKFKDTLCNRQLALNMRIKLFGSVVTPCTLYACGAWTMTVENENLLKTARRKMLRWIVRVARTSDEDWLEYITRATHQSEELPATYGANDWVQLQRQRK